MSSKEGKIERIKRYQTENRPDWYFYPWWKKILYFILMPILFIWVGLAWCIMKIGKWLYLFGNFMTGYGWNGGNWTEDV